MGVEQLHVLHMAHEVVLGGVSAQASVEGLLLGHRCDGAAGVAVTGVENTGVRQVEDLAGDRAPEGVGIALLEVAATAAAHQQGIAGEGHASVVEHEGDAAIGVAWGAVHLHGPATERHPISVMERQRDVFGAGGGSQADGRAGGLMHQPAAGDVIGVGVGVQTGHQADAEFADQ